MELSDAALTASCVSVPDHVAHREFAAESIALNLHTGRYHGLNPTAGRMFAALGEGGTIGGVAERLAAEFGQPQERVEGDLLRLCRELAERELIVVHTSRDD